jgi:hypothetical protein
MKELIPSKLKRILVKENKEDGIKTAMEAGNNFRNSLDGI